LLAQPSGIETKLNVSAQLQISHDATYQNRFYPNAFMLKQRSQALSFKSGKNSKKLENLTVINSMSIRPLLKEN